MISPHEFVVDEDGFSFVELDADQVNESLDSFTKLLSSAGAPICKWSEIWHVENEIAGTLTDLLFSSPTVSRDVATLLGASLDQLANWDLLTDRQPHLGITSGGRPIAFAPSLAFCALTRLEGGRLDALTTSLAGRSGQISLFVTETSQEATIESVDDLDALRDYWRRRVCAETAPATRVEELARTLFPNCIFAPNFFNQFGSLAGTYPTLLPEVVRHLSALSDHAPEVWAARSQNHERAAEMASRTGVECSPESPVTHRNKAAMAQRKVTFGDRPIVCEWHTKIEPHRNRIHFFVDGELVYVGCMHEHLMT